MDTGLRLLKVGDVARAIGVSVRTLHHYEEVGLLDPTLRTEGGYRMYGESAIRRLQQIRSLQSIGLSLDEIAAYLKGPDSSLLSVFQAQLSKLRNQLELQQSLCRRLEWAVDTLQAGRDLSLDEMLETMKEMTMFEKYYTPEQMDELKKRAGSVGPERMAQVQEEWRRLFEAYAQEMKQGTDPAHPRVRELAARSRRLIGEFTGGNPGIEQSLGHMYQSEGGPQVLQKFDYGVDPELWDYMQRAAAAGGSSDSPEE